MLIPFAYTLQLLLGCALPFLLSFVLRLFTESSHSKTTGILEYTARNAPSLSTSTITMAACGQLLPYLGVITVGVGDAVAAIVGSSRWGRHRWVVDHDNNRTVEGTLGGWLSMCVFTGEVQSGHNIIIPCI
jgi:dolichol kinase